MLHDGMQMDMRWIWDTISISLLIVGLDHQESIIVGGWEHNLSAEDVQ